MILLADGGIGAIGALAEALLIVFGIAVAVIIGLVIFITWIVRVTSSDSRPRRRLWPFDRLIPIGLRLAAALQFVGAVAYGFAAFMSLLFLRPDALPSIQHTIAFTVVTAGAIVTGVGYLRGSRRFGLVGATIVAGFVLLNAAVYLMLHGRWGIDFLAPAYALGILLLLHLRYRPYFEGDSAMCQRCGYDLRAASDRCSECGTETRAEAA